MKYFVFFCVFICAASVAYGSVAFSMPDKKTDCSSGECIDYCNYELKSLRPGESLNKNCNLVVCNEDFSMHFESCGTASTDKCKRFEDDLSLTYPECCNQICVEPRIKEEENIIASESSESD